MATPVTQVNRILEAVLAKGWRRASIVIDTPWWAAEFWELESDWAPQGKKAWLAFLVNPLEDDPKPN